MKVLDLFCGRGGWSKPFVEDGDTVWGVDIDPAFKNVYPGTFFCADVSEWKPPQSFDFVVGSTPCVEFSDAKLNWRWHPEGQNIVEGLRLVHEFEKLVEWTKTPLWAMENVSHLAWWYPRNPIWHFKISRGGRRALWGNIPIGQSPEFHFNRSLYKDYSSKDKAERAEIPYPIARFVADCVKSALKEKAILEAVSE